MGYVLMCVECEAGSCLRKGSCSCLFFCLLHMLRISVDVRIAGYSSQGIMGQNL